MHSSSLLLSLATAGALAGTVTGRSLPRADTTPSVTLSNGTLAGAYSSYFGTDSFLGIPYAQPPVGELRYRVPQSVNVSWDGTLDASSYGPACYGYDTWTAANNDAVSEDCLYLNVIRPHGYENQSLPVAVWIYGGGLSAGTTQEPNYNLTFLVQRSASIGSPIIAASMNYRLSSWGFLFGKELQESGNTNLGFRDQRLALHWIQENIAAFGGDPTQVTIFGQSSGGTSVGAQLLAYNGRDDGLFARAIAESGPLVALTSYANASEWQVVYDNITAGVGCSSAADTLACLRTVSSDSLNAVINSSATSGAGFFQPLQYGAVIDNDFFVKPASLQLQEGAFNRVPFLLGTNQDESPGAVKGINTTAQFMEWLHKKRVFDNQTVSDLAYLYPDTPWTQPPFTLAGRPSSSSGLGRQYKRVSAFCGDFGQHASARLTSFAWSAYNTTTYQYLWDVLVNGGSYTTGAAHAMEIPFVLYNTEGYGSTINPLGGVNREKYLAMADLMSTMWIGFFYTGNPNALIAANYPGGGIETWEPYTQDAPNHYYFNLNETSHMEVDSYRTEAINYLNNLQIVAGAGNCTGLKNCAATPEFLYGSTDGLWGW